MLVLIIAPDVFTIDHGTYTPEVAVEWFKDPTLGKPAPLFKGRTLRYSSNTDGWEVAGAIATSAWKHIDDAAKPSRPRRPADTSKASEGYYELVSPKSPETPTA